MLDYKFNNNLCIVKNKNYINLRICNVHSEKYKYFVIESSTFSVKTSPSLENHSLKRIVQLLTRFLRQKVLDFSTFLEPFGLQSGINNS